MSEDAPDVWILVSGGLTHWLFPGGAEEKTHIVAAADGQAFHIQTAFHEPDVIRAATLSADGSSVTWTRVRGESTNEEIVWVKAPNGTVFQFDGRWQLQKTDDNRVDFWILVRAGFAQWFFPGGVSESAKIVQSADGKSFQLQTEFYEPDVVRVGTLSEDRSSVTWTRVHGVSRHETFVWVKANEKATRPVGRKGRLLRGPDSATVMEDYFDHQQRELQKAKELKAVNPEKPMARASQFDGDWQLRGVPDIRILVSDGLVQWIFPDGAKKSANIVNGVSGFL